MTGWLGGWLKDIVLIILIAVFLDLLIPNSALQRYVKVVISLMITLTILTPVISLLQSEKDVRQAAETALGEVRGDLPELSAILKEGGRLKLDAESRSAELAAAQMEEMIRFRLDGHLAVKANDVSVGITSDEKSGQAKVSQIRIQLAALPATSDTEGTASEIFTIRDDAALSPDSVRSVEPVAVDVRAAGTEKNSSAVEEPENALVEPDYSENEQRIKRYLKEWLGVDERLIAIDWSGSERRK